MPPATASSQGKTIGARAVPPPRDDQKPLNPPLLPALPPTISSAVTNIAQETQQAAAKCSSSKRSAAQDKDVPVVPITACPDIMNMLAQLTSPKKKARRGLMTEIALKLAVEIPSAFCIRAQLFMRDFQAKSKVVKEMKILSEQRGSVVAMFDRSDRDGVRWELACPEQSLETTLKLFMTILNKCIPGGVTVKAISSVVLSVATQLNLETENGGCSVQSVSPESEFRLFGDSDSLHLQWLTGFSLFFQPSLKDTVWANWSSISDGNTFGREYIGDVSMVKIEFEKVCKMCGDRRCSIELPAKADMENLHSVSIPDH